MNVQGNRNSDRHTDDAHLLRREMRALIDTIPGCYYVYNTDGKLVQWNQGFLDATGMSEAECLDHVMSSSITAEDRAASQDAHLALASLGRATTRAKIENRLTGELTPFFFSSIAIPDGDGHNIVGVGIDITDTVKTENELHEQQAFFKTLLDSSFDEYVVISPEHEILAHNRKLIDSAAPAAEFAAVRFDYDLIAQIAQHTDDPSCFLRDMSSMRDAPTERSRFVFRTTSGTVHECMASPVLDDVGTWRGQLLTFRDITEHERAQARYEHLATHDEVTGLLNRTALFEKLDALIALGEPFGLISFDIERFKRYNQAYGHVFGDRVLRLIGEQIREGTETDHIIGRHGGDEFLIIVPDCKTRESLAEVAESLKRQFKGVKFLEGRELDFVCHMGLCGYPSDGTTVAELITHSDYAMTHLQSQGRSSHIFYTAEMGQELSQRIALEKQLRLALTSHNFSLVYQPRVDLGTGRITGVEALIRWHDPQLGWVSPANFIPLAEKTRLILPLGEWVMLSACAQAKLWQDRGMRDVPVAVNVSLIQILESDFVETVERILSQTGLDPHLLEFELTESTIAEDPDLVRGVIARLGDSGVRMSIDDYGTGYSSLSYLKNFQVDKLKIDQSFIHSINSSPADNAIVQTAITVAATLGIAAIAEGVETIEQAEFLRASGCAGAQGYLFGKPVSPLEIERMFADERQGVLTPLAASVR